MPGSVPFLCLPATSADAPRRLVIMSDPTHCQRACASVPSTDTRSRTPLRQCSLLNYPHPRAQASQNVTPDNRSGSHPPECFIAATD